MGFLLQCNCKSERFSIYVVIPKTLVVYLSNAPYLFRDCNGLGRIIGLKCTSRCFNQTLQSEPISGMANCERFIKVGYSIEANATYSCMTSKDGILDTLKQASEGLFYSSESDYPFEVFSWPTIPQTPEQVVSQTGHPKNTPIQTVDFDKFFAQVTQEKDWYGPEEKATVAKYLQLVETLKSSLKDIQVYRVGETESDVYVGGKTSEGTFAGISTKVVET
jgi:Nuclease A inhibitor-like protein